VYRLAIAICFALFLTATQEAASQSAEITLDGESFTSKFTANPPNGNKIIELVRDQETITNWTKLIGFRYNQMPEINNDPLTAAVRLSQLLKSMNLGSLVTEKKESGEAMIDFITRANNGSLEFNVFRYAKSKDNKAVVSLQFSYRIADSPETKVPEFQKLRASWLQQAAAFDMRIVHDALAK